MTGVQTCALPISSSPAAPQIIRNASQNAVKTQASIKGKDMAGGLEQQGDAEGRSGSPSAARGSTGDPSSAQMGGGVGRIIKAHAVELITLLESFQFCPAKCNHSHVSGAEIKPCSLASPASQGQKKSHVRGLN